ncbi:MULTISPECIES: hypothetical protein [Nostocales]|uniref:Uncharacterized protein n=3 Tax=Nostocales TaxID=1161 RepID=A0A8S9T9B8_9CYAN|nr:hypothetical protein [Tolypothrix bouteillei]KAF3888678.1 hypothetical protein DA73_0400026750 [Tolypothrix bouteillei VB521301]
MRVILDIPQELAIQNSSLEIPQTSLLTTMDKYLLYAIALSFIVIVA